jgi:hypothetical protein
MSLFKKLNEQFGPPSEVEPFGICLIIQSPNFDLAWVKTLVEVGYSIVFATLDGYPVVFIPCKRDRRHRPAESESQINEVCTLQNDKKEKTESPVPKITIDQSDVILDLVKNYQILSDGYESLSTLYSELKTNYNGFVETVEGSFEKVRQLIEADRKENVETNAECKMLKEILVRHKHAVSGEGMLPLEPYKR